MVMKLIEGATEFAKHIQSMVRGIANNGVLGADITDGSLNVTPHGSSNRTVIVAIGKALINGTVYEETGTTDLTHDAVVSSGNKRRDLIIYDQSASNPAIEKGTEGTDPNPPALADEDDIILAIVLIEYGDTLLGAGDITDMRTILRQITKKIWLTAMDMVAETGSPSQSNYGYFTVWELDQSTDEAVIGEIVIPEDWFETDIKVYIVFMGATVGGTVKGIVGYSAKTIDEACNVETGNNALDILVPGVAPYEFKRVLGLTIPKANIAKRDYLGLRMYRDADLAGDNFTSNFSFFGFEIEYTTIV